MSKIVLLVSLAMLGTLFLAIPATAQTTACDQVQARLNMGDPNLTSAELLSCGLSPEAISPCEGSTDPNCDNTGYPSIGGPNGVGENNACSGLPEGSLEAVACYEELIANMGLGPAPSQYQYTPDVVPDIQYAPTEQSPTATQTPTAELADTGGPSLVMLASALLIGGGMIFIGGGMILKSRRS